MRFHRAFPFWNDNDEEMQLVVKKPGINLDYAVFLLDDDDSNVGILGKYEFIERISGIYCGTNGEGFDFSGNLISFEIGHD